LSRQITKELAKKIVKKLKAAQINTSGSAHDEYLVEEDGIQIAIINIRRGSDKDLGHDYIPKEIHIGPNDAKNLANCPMSRDQYIAKLREKGVLPRLDEPNF
jgi:hypothetical protein